MPVKSAPQSALSSSCNLCGGLVVHVNVFGELWKTKEDSGILKNESYLIFLLLFSKVWPYNGG